MSVCRHCREEYEPYRCRACRSRRPIFHACQECHDEIIHGLIGPPIQSRAGRPDRAAAVDIRYHGDNGPRD
ncbi:MAG: hypothetical protein HZA50_13905 [Planctomycetes bacterium]|nr:hypothetical protein [Planctomycetota bacterium]